MKNKIFLLLIIQTLFSVEAMFGQITFQKTFGGTGPDNGLSVQQTTDGGYISTGWTVSFGAGYQDVYLIKTNANGDSLWTKTFGGSNDDWANSVQQTSDGSYIIVGATQSFGASDYDVYLIKTDTNGDTIWTKTFGGANDDYGISVQETSDGEYIVAGRTISFGAGNEDVYLVKTDGNGDLLWTKTFGGADSDYGSFVYQTTDGGFIITGWTNSFGAGSFDVYLIKTDFNGDSLWTKTFGGTSDDAGKSVQQTTDGGYIITGGTSSFGAGICDIYLINVNVNGDTIWTKTFGGTGYDAGLSVEQTTNAGYIICGTTNSFGAGAYDFYLIKTDASGDSLWTKAFGGTSTEYWQSVKQTSDGGYIIAGNTFSFGAGNYDVYLIKTDSLGNSGCNESSTNTIITTPTTQVTSPATIVTSPPTIVTSPATIVGSGGTVTTLCTTVGIPPIFNFQSSIFNISPNPFSNEINITNTANELSEIILYDITSRKLLQQTFSNSASINTSQLSKGIYIYEVRNINAVIKKGKVIKE